MASNTNTGSEPPSGLAELIALYRQLGQIGATLFAPLARAYVGNVEATSERRRESTQVVSLALHKLAFEAGELLVAKHPPSDQPIAEFAIDPKTGHAPDLKLAYVAAAALAYMKSRDEQAARAASPPTPHVTARSVQSLRTAARVTRYGGTRMIDVSAISATAPTVRSTGGCGCGGGATTGSGGCGCGGTRQPPPPPTPPCYDPCAGGLVRVPPATESCGCDACRTAPADCPPFWSISCETKTRLRECLKVALCDVVRALPDTLCSPTQPNQTPLAAALCNFLRCLPDALCPPDHAKPCGPKGPMPCLPCGYAVEVP